MNHQYIKEWLTSDETITAEQSQRIEDHIKVCTSCQQFHAAWVDIQHLIKTDPDIDPRPGFASRLNVRMTRQQKYAQKRLTWTVFASLTSIAVVVMLLLGIQIYELVRSPEQIALVFISRFAVVISYLTITKDYLNYFSTLLPNFSFPTVVFMIGILTLLCVVWLASMKQISRVWRIVK